MSNKNKFESVTTQLTIDRAPVKIHAFSTGMVAIKTKFRESKRKKLFGILSILLDPEFTEWLPIWVWVIEHPEGIFVIDSGVSTNINDKNYFNKTNFFTKWFNRTLFRFQIDRQQEIDIQLQNIGIDITDVKALILTHLHIDHVDGLKHFPNTKIMVSKMEWEKSYGAIPQLFPKWLKPELIELSQSHNSYEESYILTQDKNLIALHTSGHTHGGMSILLKTDQCNLLFVGDVCYEQEQILESKYSGANASAKEAEATYLKILQLANTCQLIILPSHDKDSGQRLKFEETI